MSSINIKKEINREFIRNNITLFIGCTVDSKGVIHTGRSDPADRIKDITMALSKWLPLRFFKKVIIVENSNYEGLEITKIIEKHASDTAIELIVYDGQNYD